MKCVIIGAGPSGLSAGYRLAMRGHEVTIFEKQSMHGGLAKTIWDGNFGFDMGPHHFHTTHSDILDGVTNLLGNKFETVPISSQIYFRNQWVNYPFTLKNMLSAISPAMAIKCSADFIGARTLKRQKAGANLSFEDWVVRRYGRSLFNLYFGPYAQKVWGVKASELSAEVGEERVPYRGVASVLLNLLGLSKTGHPEDPRALESYYPRQGIGMLCDALRTQLENLGGIVITNSRVKSIKATGKNINSLSIITNGTGPKEEKCDALIWSGPIDELLELTSEHVGQIKIGTKQELSYRSQRQLYIKLLGRGFLPTPYVYFSSPRIPFTRIYETTQMSENMAPLNMSGLVVEFNLDDEDKLWNCSFDKFKQATLEQLKRIGLIKEKQILDCFDIKIDRAYPVYGINWKNARKEAIERISTLKNLIPIGRQGMFSYANIDHAMKMGIDAAETIEHGNLNEVSSLLEVYLCNNHI